LPWNLWATGNERFGGDRHFHWLQSMQTNIKRTLAYEDRERGRMVIGEDELRSFSEPVVILGDPGLGKSMLTWELGKQAGMRYFRAGTFERRVDLASLVGRNECVIVDGLDEIASAAPGGAVDAVLRKLSALSNPPFILSCREADWLGAADRVKIEDDYGSAPVLLHLQPFTRDDARAFLSQKFPEVDADGLLVHLADHGIETLYGNPLTLRLLGEVARAAGPLPETRAGLFDQACRVMLKEDNPRHHQDPHVQATDEDLLLAAGAICAAQLLCGRVGIHMGPYAETPGEYLNIVDITGLQSSRFADEAIRTRLFQAEGENRFTHIHRVIAEYLGAKWLARCFEAGVSKKRLFGLFRQGEGVPTSLRGLHAWMAHFSDVLAAPCINVDPYAVLRYGDAETLDLDQARNLLVALRDLSEENPYFRSEDWGQHPASGLVRPELRDEILAIVQVPSRDMQFTVLLLEAMAGTTLAQRLRPELETILFDRDRSVVERSCAGNALYTAAVSDDWETRIRRLLAMEDANSARLAFEILRKAGLSAVPIGTAVGTVLAYLGLARNQDSQEESAELKYVPDSLFSGLDTQYLASWLDELTERARPLMEKAGYETEWYVTRLVRHLAAQVLEANHSIQPERVWMWVGWLGRYRLYNDDGTKRLAAIFRKDRVRRAALLEQVLLTPCAESTWMAAHRLADTGLGLFPKGEDIAGSLRTLRARAGEGRIDVDTWRELLLLNRSVEGLATVVREAALDAANEDPELLSVLAELSRAATPKWETRRAKRQAKEEAHRQEYFRRRRRELTERAQEIAAGDIPVLQESAAVYLGRWHMLNGEFYGLNTAASPVERLREFLGDDLCHRVMSGFNAVLRRDDLPSASRIAENYGGNEEAAAAPMICGVAEMIRRGDPIDKINRDTLAAVYMAWRHASRSNDAAQIDIGPALEDVLFKSEWDWEVYFRASVEPQLAKNREHIQELYYLEHEPRFATLAGCLAVDWLRAHPGLPPSIVTLLLTCALESACDEEVQTLVGRMLNVQLERETMLLWRSAAYVIDFDRHRASLKEAAADNPALLWLIRDRMGPARSERFDRFSLEQLAFVVEAFGSNWPIAYRPGTVTVGKRNPWDASEFIKRVIYAVAGRPTPNATEALQNLIANCAPSYADTMKHALALQRRARRDDEYAAPTVKQLRAVMACGLPEDIGDMQVWFADQIETLQDRIRNSDTNMWEAYWNGERPRHENFCRNRLIEHMSGSLPPSIRFGPETLMPRGKKADIALTRNTIKLPVEIKGQWHSEVWSAASDQLDAKYAVDWQAEGRGVYLVLWFGDIAGKPLPRHPEGLALPQSPGALRGMLMDRLPEARRSWIDVFVIDVSKPDGTA